jgi:spore coat polysaccharide biosynthesis protein SpsF
VRIAAIVQARVDSTRLPRKVLEDLAGEPMLARVISRTCRAACLTTTIVATTTKSSDDAIVRLCEDRGWSYYRGSEDDVLDRYYQTALTFEVDIIARMTSDCPLIDADVIDQVVSEFLARRPNVDYASNTVQRTFPRGLDVEVLTFEALERSWHEDTSPTSREHVTPYIWQHPDGFKIHNVANDVDYSHMRWTVDTLEDLTLVRLIYDHFGNDAFSWRDVLHLLHRHQDWLKINQNIQQKVVPP